MVGLDTLRPGSRARLVSVSGSRGFRRRLLEMGLLPGTPVRLVRHTQLGGLLELEVRGAHLSLRRAEASEVLVSPLPEGAADPRARRSSQEEANPGADPPSVPTPRPVES